MAISAIGVRSLPVKRFAEDPHSVAQQMVEQAAERYQQHYGENDASHSHNGVSSTVSWTRKDGRKCAMAGGAADGVNSGIAATVSLENSHTGLLLFDDLFEIEPR